MSTTLAPKAPDYVSYSALSTFIQCGEQYRLTRIQRAPEQPALWFLGGNAVHRATESYDLLDWNGAATPSANDLFLEFWEDEKAKSREKHPDVPFSEYRVSGRSTKDFPDKFNERWWVTKGPGMVQNWIEFRTKSGFQILDSHGAPLIEVDVVGTLGGVTVKGFIDRVMVAPTGEVIVLDLKSGQRTPSNPVQLAIYAELIAQRMDIRPEKGAYWMAPKGEIAAFGLGHLSTEVLTKMVTRMKASVDAGLFIPNLDSYCATCGVNQFCTAYGAPSNIYSEV